MASFQAKIGWKSSKKGGNKNYRSVSFQPGAKQEILKRLKKIQKIKNTNMASFQAKIGWKRMRN